MPKKKARAKPKAKAKAKPQAESQEKPPRMTAAEQVDRELAAEALRKRQAGQQPSARETAALRRIEKDREETLRWQYYGSIPQKHWRRMSGRQTKVLHEQADLYGIPFGGPTIDLSAVARAVHDFLAEHAATLALAMRRRGGPAPEGDGPTDWLEEYRRERALMARLEREAAEARYLPRSEVHTAFGRIAGVLRRAGDLLERHAGGEARQILQEALDRADREIDNLCADSPDVDPDAPEPDPDDTPDDGR